MSYDDFIKIVEAVELYDIQEKEILRLALNDEINLYVFYTINQDEFDYEELRMEFVRELSFYGYIQYRSEHDTAVECMVKAMNRHRSNIDGSEEKNEIKPRRINSDQIFIKKSELITATWLKMPEPLKLKAAKELREFKIAKKDADKFLKGKKIESQPARTEIIKIIYNEKEYIREEVNIADKCFQALYRSVNSSKSPDENHTDYINTWLSKYKQPELSGKAKRRILHLVNPNPTRTASPQQ